MSYSGLLPEDYSYAKNLAEQRKNNALKVNNPIKANTAVGNRNLTGMRLNRGIEGNKLRIQELSEAGRLGEAGQLSQVGGLKIGENLTNLANQAVTTGQEIVQNIGSKANDLLKAGSTTKDAATAAKMFDGTKAGFAKGMNAVAMVASAIEAMQIGAKEGKLPGGSQRDKEEEQLHMPVWGG